jgi:hypothetical protein
MPPAREGVGRGWQKPGMMDSKANRTLVKSTPELWELADDRARMEAWMAGFVGGRPVGVEVTDREPERLLAWRAAAPAGGDARIALELAEKGLGTAVSITAQQSRLDRAGADAALERLLDELGSPGRRRIAAG